MEVDMIAQGYQHFAQALVFAHGARAETEAARHAILCEKSGDPETAETWRQVQSAVYALRLKKAA